MPATPLSTVTSTDTGTTWPATDGTAGDVTNFNSYVNGPNVCVVMTNSGAATYTVDVVTPNAVGGNLIADKQISLTAGQRQIFGPFNNAIYGDTVILKPSNAAVKFIVVQHT